MKKITYLFSFLLFIGCQNKVIEKVEETFPNEAKKVVFFYEVNDKKKVLIREKHFYPNGKLKMEGAILNGKRNGKWIAYFEDEKTQSIGFFENGFRKDEVEVYYPNGNVMYKGFFKKDKKVGLWKFYTKSGKLASEKKY